MLKSKTEINKILNLFLDHEIRGHKIKIQSFIPNIENELNKENILNKINLNNNKSQEIFVEKKIQEKSLLNKKRNLFPTPHYQSNFTNFFYNPINFCENYILGRTNYLNHLNYSNNSVENNKNFYGYYKKRKEIFNNSLKSQEFCVNGNYKEKEFSKLSKFTFQNLEIPTTPIVNNKKTNCSVKNKIQTNNENNSVFDVSF